MKKLLFSFIGIITSFALGMAAPNGIDAYALPYIHIKNVINKTDSKLTFQKEGIDIEIPAKSTINLAKIKRQGSRATIQDTEIVMTKGDQGLKSALPLLIYRADSQGSKDSAKNYIKIEFHKKKEKNKWNLIADLQLCKKNTCSSKFNKKAQSKTTYKLFDNQKEVETLSFDITINGKDLKESQIKKVGKIEKDKRDYPEAHWFQHGKRTDVSENMRRAGYGLEEFKGFFGDIPTGPRPDYERPKFEYKPIPSRTIPIEIDEKIYQLLDLKSDATADEVLGISAAASEGDIKIAHRKMLFIWHPDRYKKNEQYNKEDAGQVTRLINAAYDLLSNK